MATVGQVGELVSAQLRERVDRLVSAVDGSAPDFAEVASLADAVGEFADTIAEIYEDLEQTLMSGLRRGSDSEHESDDSQKAREPRRRQTQPHSDQDGTTEETTREELLDQARELNVHGRSSMAKEELAQAVEEEESLTKDDLLERARAADIEGRSSMTKEELREALRETGA